MLTTNTKVKMTRAVKTDTEAEAIAQWLKENEVTVCEPHARTDPDDIEYTFKVGRRGRPSK
jgi:hypothetical protein